MTERVPAEEVLVGRKIVAGGKTYWVKDPDEPIFEGPWQWEPDIDLRSRNRLFLFSEGFLGLHRPEGFVHVSGC